MRILLLIDRLNSGGGTETHVLTLARGLRRLGHHVTIYTSGGPWVANAQRCGLVVVSQSSMMRLGQREVTGFAEFLKNHPFDIVHAHETVGFTIFHRARPLLKSKPPFVFTLHSPYIGPRTLRRVCETAQAVISVSAPFRKRLTRFGCVSPRKVSIIPNGVDMETFRPTLKATARKTFGITPQRFVIGYAARFTTDKIGLGERVSNSLKNYAMQNRNIQILIAGRASRKHVRPASNVKVLGHLDKMEVFDNACDVVIGTGRVAAETLACGTPSILIGHGGYHGLVTSRNISRMIAHNFADHAEPPYNAWTKQQLHNLLSVVRRNIKLVNKDTERVRTMIHRRLSTGTMVQQVVSVYKSIAHKR